MSPISRNMLEKYLRGECSPDEEKHVRNWFDLNDAGEYPTVLDEKEYSRKEQKLWGRLTRSLRGAGMSVKGNRRPYRRAIPYAAAVVLLLSVWFAWEQLNPGFWRNGSSYSTASGEVRSFSLPDGTVVTLNAMSRIKIPADYGRKDRSVYLEGEGYFMVQKNPDLAFTVYSNDIATTALGTIFNVSAYPTDGETIVSLHEGSVSVNRKGGEENSVQHMVLEPGEEIICSGNGNFVRKLFNRMERLGWKDQVIYFDQADLQEVIRKLERYYGVSFDYRELEGDNWELTGEYRYVPLKDILESLSFNYGIKYKIEDEQVTLFK
ncbi:FecR family protein [Anseongella ginsenosidimutans]|uniref:FecR family protein n=1 Tax=Anseongella ginsenosidimutans TaxID=496056 RepID=A0A4V2UTE0_9SPHI|nr:FecR family protein [Anseongella ginsenosidimutans]QEC52761.1 DUF4974 domain-containing protein [Anseongella ginsenosidimutans]TCS85519.1 FecR family protein [Anseongella ginsenosidimutans]